MSYASKERSQSSVAEVAGRARVASRALAKLSNQSRNELLMAVAKAIEDGSRKILQANERDCHVAEPAVSAGTMSSAMLARLHVSSQGVDEMATRVREVSRMPDALGRRLAGTELDDGIVLCKESCPLGVIGIVFESRPDVVPQVAARSLKSGNAVLLKGGAEAAHTNEALVAIWRECLAGFPYAPLDSIHLLQTRADVMGLLTLDRNVDLIIPRGSRELVQFVVRNSRIPILGHGEGICHVYVDRAADMEKALRITLDSKVQYPAACNAAETLLVHQDVATEFLPKAFSKLRDAGVEVRGCSRTIALLAKPEVIPATEDDWATEYSDLILAVKIVADAAEAIMHVHRYGSGHTETIVTEDREAARKFLDD